MFTYNKCKVLSFILAVSLCLYSSMPSYALNSRSLFTHKSTAQRHLETPLYEDIVADPSLLDMPDALGRVVEYHKGKTSRLVIHIQDHHTDPVAQKSIASIVELLNTKHNVQLMCLEGAWDAIDTSFYNRFKDTALKEKISILFVDEALFTGPEFYKINNKGNYIRAVGAESNSLYLKHLSSHKDNQIKKSNALTELDMVKSAVDALKLCLYPDDLISLDNLSSAYSSRQLSLKEYSQKLYEYAVKYEISIDSRSDLYRFMGLIEQEQIIDFKQAESERESLIRFFSENMPQENVSELVRMAMDFRSHKIPDIVFYDYLEGLMLEHSINNMEYANLFSYIGYVKGSKDINYLKAFDEVYDLARQIKITLCSNNTQKSLIAYSESINILENLYNLRVTPKDFEYMESHPEYFKIEDMKRFLTNTYTALGLNEMPAGNADRYDTYAIQKAKEFYRLAFMRDAALTNNTLERMNEYHTNMAILTAGGFHTKGITKILKDNDISYIVICPSIGSEDYRELYHKRMNGILPDIISLKSALYNTLSVPLAFNTPAVKGLFDDLYNSEKMPADGQSEKATSSGIAGHIAKGIVYLSAALVLGGTVYTGKQAMDKRDRTVEYIQTAKTLPASQWQAILDALRAFYDLIEDVDAPPANSLEMRSKIGNVAFIIETTITPNLESIYKYSAEQGIDPYYIMAIMLSEQLDLRNADLDKILPLLGYDSSRGIGQIKEMAIKEYCLNTRWPSFDNKLTEDLLPSELKHIVEGKGEYADEHIRAIINIVSGIRKHAGGDTLRIAHDYTSGTRDTMPPGNFTFKELKENEDLRSWLYAMSVDVFHKFFKAYIIYLGGDKLYISQGTERGMQAKPASAGNVIKRPLDFIDSPRRIFIVGDYKTLSENKLGENIIAMWALVTAVHKRFPEAHIYVSFPYNDFYNAEMFNRKIIPVPSDIEQINNWYYGQEEWVFEDPASGKKSFYKMPELCQTTYEGREMRDNFIKDKNIDMVFEVSLNPGRFWSAEKSSKNYDLFSILSPLSITHALRNTVEKPRRAIMTYSDKQGILYNVELDSHASEIISKGSLSQGGIWDMSMAFCRSLGLDVDRSNLMYIQPTAVEYEQAVKDVATLTADNSIDSWNPGDKLILVNVYAKTQENLMGVKSSVRAEQWAEYLAKGLEHIEDAYVVFTRGGEMDEDIEFVEHVAERLKQKSKDMLQKNRNHIIFPRASVYSLISNLLMLADAVITLDTGMSHLASGVFNVPTLLITEENILHWATTRNNLYPVCLETQKIYEDISREEEQLSYLGEEYEDKLRAYFRQQLEDKLKSAHDKALKKIVYATRLLNQLVNLKPYPGLLKEIQNTYASIKEYISNKGEEAALEWLSEGARQEELINMLKAYYEGEDVLIDESVIGIFPALVAERIITKSNDKAESLFSGTLKLSAELCDMVNTITHDTTSAFYSDSKAAGLGNITFITTADTWTEADKERLKKLALRNKGLSEDSLRKVSFITLDNRSKDVLKECGFTDTGNRPSVFSVDDFSFLSDAAWKNLSLGERIAMITSHIQCDNSAIITMTDDKAADSIEHFLSGSKALDSRKTGKVIITSMQAASRDTMVDNYLVKKGKIMFGVLFPYAMKSAEMVLKSNMDIKLYVPEIFPLPAIDKITVELLNTLMDMKISIEAASKAA